MAASTTPRFSVVVLARNEARALPRLLRSLAPFRDRGGEVLVLDTGSTDDTMLIARQHGCRVEAAGPKFESALTAADAAAIEQRFSRGGEGPLVAADQRLFHFGDARQYASLLAGHDIVIQLDASDEVLALDLAFLEDRIENGAGHFGYDLLNGNVRLRVSRFYDRRRSRWTGRVHETLESVTGSDPPATPVVECDAAQLLVRHHKEEGKARHYLAGLALQVIERPGEPRWWHYLGRELFYAEWHQSAIAVLEKHATMNNGWRAERSQSLCFAAESFAVLGMVDAAIRDCTWAATLDPARREPLLRLSSLHSQRGEFGRSVELANQSLAIPQTSAYPEPVDNYTWLPHSLLYWGLFWLGRTDEARLHWEICRSLAPENEAILKHARLFTRPPD